MFNSWHDVVDNFPTIPYLFVGSGITRRYLDLPNWEELLKVFAERLSEDEFKFVSLKSQANDDLAQVGSLIEKEFNNKWFGDPAFRTKSSIILDFVKNGKSPFKAELAFYIKDHSSLQTSYQYEIDLLRELSVRNISGFITTNYDTFLEDLCPDHKVYGSQEELFFSTIHSVGEIFKIHGTVEDPSTIVITKEDYKNFEEKSQYLASKLMTIFVEYPIIFIGYSLSDPNIRKILSSIVCVLSPQQILELSNRIIFVKRNSALNDKMLVGSHSVDIGGRVIQATKVETNNFALVFEELKNKKLGYPVRLLRRFKDELYQYVKTEKPSKHCLVEPYDPKVPDEAMVFSLGINQSIVGLVGFTADDWYKAVLTDDELAFDIDNILNFAYPKIHPQNLNLPVCKFLSLAKEDHKGIVQPQTYEDLLNNTIKKNRDSKLIGDRSVKGVLKQFEGSFEKQLRYLAYLRETEIDIGELQDFLKLHINNFSGMGSGIKSDFRRLIRVFDWLKYHK